MSYYHKYVDPELFIGKTFTKIEKGSDEIIFHTSEGKRYLMLHVQDCCESVSIEKIKGDLDSLIGSPIVSASKEYSNDWPSDADDNIPHDDSYTWTTYVFTTKDSVVSIRWFGTSNGYYSESVDIAELL